MIPTVHRFLQDMHHEGFLPHYPERWAEVQSEIMRIGRYVPNFAELDYAAKVAWRNSVRCVGRHYWQSLKVTDARAYTDHHDVWDVLLEHINSATNQGNIVPTLTVLNPEVSILNDQLIRYAGYADCGDPKNRPLTETLMQLGWQPPEPRSDFDVLPLAIDVSGQVKLFSLPPEKVLEVHIQHPQYSWLKDLGLKWHALPAISNMALTVGSTQYPCVFNGWYVETEVAARNFGDEQRYHLLHTIAQHMGEDTRTLRTLWKDKAMLVLHEAVLYSFEQAKVKMVDHHTVAQHFERFCERERKAGREVKARWSWIVPPISGSTSPQFHKHYDDTELHPNFVVYDSKKCPIEH